MTKYYFYKLTHDNGGAPCITGNLLSLAICKPVIRSTAAVGDIILGFAASSLHGDNRLLYVSRVTQRLTKGEYFRPVTYRHRADCIYSWRAGAYLVRTKARYHGSIHDLHHDLGDPPEYAKANTLLSEDFCYFGRAGSDAYKQTFPIVAQSLAELKQGHRVYHSLQLFHELERLAIAYCPLKGAHVLGSPSEQPAKAVCLRDDGCGVVCRQNDC